MDSTVSALIEAAHRAFAHSAHAAPAVRAAWLEAIASALESRSEELVQLAQEETHLPGPRLHGELTRTVFQLRLFAREVEIGSDLGATIDHADDAWGMGPRPDLRRLNVPLGVVGVFGASNFPFAFSVAGGDTASALATGCPVVHKVHTAHERLGRRVAEIVVEALADAGAPEGIFAAVYGREAGITLVDHPLTAAVGFTGSTSVGRALFDRAAARPTPIPFYGELGSINPVFVTEAAWSRRRREILAGYVASFTLGMGQFCTKPGILVIPQDDGLADDLAAMLADFEPTKMLSPGIRDSFVAAVAQNRAEPGVELLVGPETADSATLLAIDADDVENDPDILGREMFGPASLVVRYRDDAQLTRIADRLEGQLTATVHAEEGDDVALLIAVLEAKAGRLLWNGWPTGVTVSYAQQHGGPYPSTTMPGTTSVGTSAMSRFTRPVAYQAFPPEHLPPAVRDDNPWNVQQRVDGIQRSAATRVPESA